MLLVDGEPVLCSSAGAASRTVRTLPALSSSSARDSVSLILRRPVCLLQGAVGMELVAALAAHPGLRDAADRLKAAPETRISAGREGAPRHVYVFQREYATVDPARVEVRVDCRERVAALFSIQSRGGGNSWLVRKWGSSGGYGGSFLCT